MRFGSGFASITIAKYEMLEEDLLEDSRALLGRMVKTKRRGTLELRQKVRNVPGFPGCIGVVICAGWQ